MLVTLSRKIVGLFLHYSQCDSNGQKILAKVIGIGTELIAINYSQCDSNHR
jgi:hypothetical protein